MKYFVYYNDDYQNNGGIGLAEYDTTEDVCTFIEERIAFNPTERALSHYRVIRGVEAIIESVETVAKIKVI